MRFEEFAAARLPALLRYAMLLTGEPESARDLVQETLTRALVKWRRVEAVDEPYAYVRRILTNEYLSIMRRRRLRTVPFSHGALDERRLPAVPGPDERDGPHGDLWQRLGELPRRQRAVLVLRYYEDLSDHEIADVLGCRPATVRGYAARAMHTLRVTLTAPATSERRP